MQTHSRTKPNAMYLHHHWRVVYAGGEASTLVWQSICCAKLHSIWVGSVHLAKAKSFCTLMKSQHKAVLQILLAFVLDQVQLVEAGVRSRQALLRPIGLVNLEALRPSDPLQ